MIGWEDVYKVVASMVPLYVALGLGYGSVRWWHVFTPDQCYAVNRLVFSFTLPFYAFEFAIHADPFSMNCRLIAADIIGKLIVILVLSLWAKCREGSHSCSWFITAFSLSTLNNSLVLGLPLLTSLYGPSVRGLVVQTTVMQAIIWLTLLLFMLEIKKAKGIPLEESPLKEESRPSFWCLMRMVWLKLALNPNFYASILGITWAFIANRWQLEMPSIMEGSVLVISRAGTGMAMFCIGLFMALQKKMLACGARLTALALVLRFVVGPATMAISAFAVGLHGDVLRLAIIQAALPQSITSFIFAREYGLHADVLSTAVILGLLVCLPVLVAYNVLLGFVT